ncbi:hypothetical protein DPMN_045043 [Dreissena polymorpha]|uniref:Uncharacterized protein n=1 Tax=Dreissena polymorpha TaxID=45954 RepID=A0A9D4D5I3_DREPO|nr:hypothetical protein DPMN_045043 [Dreissena polymorpha]
MENYTYHVSILFNHIRTYADVRTLKISFSLAAEHLGIQRNSHQYQEQVFQLHCEASTSSWSRDLENRRHLSKEEPGL